MVSTSVNAVTDLLGGCVANPSRYRQQNRRGKNKKGVMIVLDERLRSNGSDQCPGGKQPSV